MEEPKRQFVAHIENSRLLDLAGGRSKVEEWEQDHLHGCRVCQSVLSLYLSQPTPASSDNPPESEGAQCAVSGMVMPRFAAGDAVYVLPQYAHLYPTNTGEVIRVVPDPYRPKFNEYVVEFADGSQAKVMEFQIIEDVPGYNTEIARLVLAGQHQPPTAHIRGHAAGGKIILQTPGYDIDMTIRVTKWRTSIMGQVLERSTTNLLKELEVRLMKDSMLVTTTRSDCVGVFNFHNVPSGPLNTLVVIPRSMTRILGAFSI